MERNKGTGMLGKKHTEASKEKISKRLKGHKAWNRKYPEVWICKYCNNEFKSQFSHKRVYCSKACRNMAFKSSEYGGKFKAGKEHPNYTGTRLDRSKTVFSYSEKKAIAESSDYACNICKVGFNRVPVYKLRGVVFDHIIAIKLGGEHEITNGQLLCVNCNSVKDGEDKRIIYKRFHE